LPEWAELAVGIPAIAGSYLVTLWYFGFGPDDRELFRLKRRDHRNNTPDNLNAESVGSR
jgi:hypothetical protein